MDTIFELMKMLLDSIISEVYLALIETLKKDMFYNKLVYFIYVKLNSGAKVDNDAKNARIASDLVLALMQIMGEDKFREDLIKNLKLKKDKENE